MSVRLSGLTVKYGDLTAVDDVTVTFPPGSTGLLGANGAGKSSLIKGLLGLVSLHSGSASIFDMDTGSHRKEIRRSIGYMPEDDCLIPGLTGIGMVQYAGELSGMSARDAMQRGHEVLFLTGLGEARYRKVETYSRGMKQRVKLAQALVHDPKLLFLDEPTSGMDPRGRLEMLDLIHYIAGQQSMSIVLATHILVDVERICNNVVIINRGRLAREGEMDQLKGSYSDAYTVRIEGEQERFRDLLEAEGCRVAEDGRQNLEVTLPPGASSRLILSAADKAGVQLRKMVSSIQTLEDVFVKTLGEDTDAGL
ncbi:MAG TPA: ABC transporter ATP-binding protein [Candidatus Krumholzibacterium sp.]|nr:ABC transporter ATP-binding protein [Candidatus Krumholzibacterium sp.]